MREQLRRNHHSRTSIPYTNTARAPEGSSYQSKSERMPHQPRRKRAANKCSIPLDPDEEYTLSPWLELLPKGTKFNSAKHRLHHEILAYIAYMEETLEERGVRQKTVAEIRRIVRGRFRNAQVLVFGSTSTGLSLPTSDIDIVLMIPHLEPADTTRTLFQLSHKFRDSQSAVGVHVNHHAHIPVLKLTMKEYYGSFNADISINNTTGTQAIEVIKGYITQMPALRPLVILLKAFLRQRNLHDASKGGLSSYALTCLCIHFLQSNPGNLPREFIDNPTESDSFGTLFQDFIYYYGFTFPYTTSYISITTSPGKILPKSEVSDFLSIRCLINPENEIAKSMNKMKAFVQSFKDAYAIILQFTDLEENLLANIVRVNQKVVEFVARRALVSTLHPCNLPNVTPYFHPLPPRPPSLSRRYNPFNGSRTYRGAQF